MSKPTIADLIAVNGPLYREIDQIILTAAQNFAARQAGGSSGSMNGALDYTAQTIVAAICKAAGEPVKYV